MLTLFRYFFSGLPQRGQRHFWWLVGFIVFSAFIEFLALGSLALFLTSLTSLEDVLSSRYVLIVRQYLGDSIFVDAKTFYWALGLTTISLVVLKNLLLACQTYFAARFDGILNVHYGNKMLQGFLNLPHELVVQRNSAETLQLIGWRVYVSLFYSSLIAIICDAVISFFLFAALFFFQPLVTLVVVLVLGAIGTGAFIVFRGRISTLSHKSGLILMVIGKVLMKGVQGVRDIKLFNRAAESLAIFDEEQQKHARYQAGQRVYERATVWVLETAGMGGLVLGSLLMIQSSDISSGKMMATLSLMAVSAWRVLPALYRSIGALGLMRGYMPFLQQIKNFLDQTNESAMENKIDSQEPLPSFTKTIELQNISFAYEKAEGKALRQVNFLIKKGQFVGIIGHSGAGKSTLADILTGLIAPSEGALVVDGTPLRKETVAAWRTQIGFVSQQPYLFDGTVAENVAFAVNKRQVNLERVRECCELAGITDFLFTLPDGLNSVIGERGSQLSGGQAQRIAIARALYNDPQVLIFDEATSALDDKTEKRIRDTIISLSGSRTIIVIAHRLKTVEDSDVLVWLEQGQVVACGTPSEILARYSTKNEE